MNTISSLLNFIGNQLFTDYVVEQGTSGNWTYRKWKSGFCEAWGEHDKVFAATTTTGALYTSSSNITIDLPSNLFNFVLLPTAEVKSYSMMITFANYTTSQLSFRPISTNSRAENTWTVRTHVIGTWK